MTTFDVAVLRFTPHVAQTRALLELLGLRPVLESETERWVELVGARGRVHLHAGDRAETTLTLWCDSVAEMARELDARGIRHDRWDESHGEQLRVPGPGGAAIEVAERQQDMYGYRALDGSGASGTVTGVWYTDDVAGDVPGFAPYGFAPEGYGDEHWQALAASPTAGLIGLHLADEGHLPSATTGRCELSLATAEPLDEVEARLEAAGHATTRYADEFVAYVAVTDPDGSQLQVHAT